MISFLEIDHIDKVFPLANGAKYVALKNVDLTIQKGEFVTLIGHSGCGKSTLLNMVAGLENPTTGGVILEGKLVKDPGPERMVVFQNYSLLPWMTVRQNIALAVNRVFRHLSKGERRGIVEQNIDLVSLRPAADKLPSQLSGGMKQRVAIARALAIRPKMLLLDEPFGALDALTRGGLQEQLMKICQESKVTCLMVTHDVDEALLLSDRIVMLTNGPEAHIGQILEVPIPRPRNRTSVVNHPSYYSLRNEMIYFLDQQKRSKRRKPLKTVAMAGNGLEKINLELGFIPLTDCAPLVVAKEKGFFAKHGLQDVTLSREPSWKAVMEGVATGRLDAAQMVTGMPIAMTLGTTSVQPTPICTAMTLSRNGNAITLSKPLYDQGVQTLGDLRGLVDLSADQIYTFGMVHPTSMHNLLLRYWLASGGIDPDADVSLLMIPPPQMVANLKAGNIIGYCSGEPWNARAVAEDVGVVLKTTGELWAGHPEKVLGVQQDWAQTYPKTHVALVAALLEACEYCDDHRNRPEIAALLSQPQYLGVANEHIRAGFIDPYNYGNGEAPAPMPRFMQFHVNQANCPDRTEMLWVMTQMARWGLIAFPKNWVEVLDQICQVGVFGKAARSIEFSDVERDKSAVKLFDGVAFNPNNPLDYLEKVEIKQPIRITEVCRV